MYGRQRLVRAWFTRQLATLAVGGTSTNNEATARRAATATTAGPSTGYADIVYSPTQVNAARILWARKLSTLGGVAATPPTLIEVLSETGMNPFHSDQRYISAEGQNAILRLVGSGVDPSGDVSKLSTANRITNPIDTSRQQENAARLKETILWLSVIIPSAYEGIHYSTDRANCPVYYESADSSSASVSSGSVQSAGSDGGLTGSASLDAIIASDTVYTASGSPKIVFKTDRAACGATFSLQAEQMLIQLAEGYASTMLMTDTSEENETPITADGEESDRIRRVENTMLSSGTSWYDATLATHASTSNGDGTRLLARFSSAFAIWANGLQYTFRLVQWLTILMLWFIGAVTA